MKHRRLFAAVFVLMLVLDQVVKAWARGRFAIGESMPWPIPGVFELTLTYNYGIAFGLFQGFGVFLAPVAVAIAGGAAWFSWKHPQEKMVTHFAMAMLAAGAIGNLIDRVWLGKVTDMFHFRAIDFPVFNVADACITISAGLLIVVWTLEGAKSGRAEAPAAVESDRQA